jgi:translation initiation factor 2-alpha kinase 4
LLTGGKVVNSIQEWLGANIKPPVEVVGSLALQMNQRAMDEERVSVILGFQTPFSYSLQARKQREEEEAKREQEQTAREEEAIQAQIKEDAMPTISEGRIQSTQLCKLGIDSSTHGRRYAY